jgi:hypothetical protein
MWLVSGVLLMAVYNIIRWGIKNIAKLGVGWEPSLHVDLNKMLIQLTEPRIVLFLFSLVLGLSMFLLLRYEMKEKIKFRYYLPYITLYLWLLAIFYIIAFGYFIIGKKPKW